MDQRVWRRAEDLFHDALNRSPEARRAFLDEACAGDQALRQQVETLLSADGRAASFLETPILPGASPPPAARGALVGRQIGPYHIRSLLGAGGMGEVYRAGDAKLGRDVAIKALPPEFAGDPDRVARLRREARALAALNHPNIATIYGLEESPDGSYLVLELVEGESPKGPLPVAAALGLACQVAEALEAAHAQGIVHRDLKPANLKVTPQGRLKVLDFGLAKAMWSQDFTPSPLPDPAGTTPDGTKVGRVLGTPGYMSPEQARGEPVDQRTDIWAFGCLVYELLTGRRAFEGESAPTAAEPALGDGPDWTALPADTPPRIRDVLRQCTERDVNRRLSRVADARVALQAEWQASRSAAASTDPAAPRSALAPLRGRLAPALLAVAALGVVAASVATWVAVGRTRQSPDSPARFALAMPGDTALDPLASSPFAVAANGSGVVYMGRQVERRQLFWHDMRGPDGWPLAGTEEADNPFLSPDGRWLGFFREGKILKLALDRGRVTVGGRVEEVVRSGPLRGATWSPDGTIVYAVLGRGLWQVAAAGGQPRQLTEPDPSTPGTDHRWPSFLPGGRDVVFTVHDAGGRTARATTAVLSLTTGRVTRVVDGFLHARYLPGGHLVLGRSGTLYAATFDPQALRLTRDPVPVLDNVSFFTSAGLVGYDIAADGSVVYVQEKTQPPASTLVWVARDGTTQDAVPDRRAYDPLNFSLSPDGTRVAVTIDSGRDKNIWILDLRERRWHPLRVDGECHAPTWSPDGDRVAFSSNLDGPRRLYVMAADGKSPPTPLGPKADMLQRPRDWSRDGRFLAYGVQTSDNTRFETHILQLDGRGSPWRWGPEGARVTEPSFSPDGRWIAYQSRESGRWEVWVRPFHGRGPRTLVSGEGGGFAPVWEGREVYYLERLADTRIMSRRVESESPLRLASKPRLAFALPFALSNGLALLSRAYAVEPGGQRVLVVQQEERPPIRALHVIANWTEEVKAGLAQRR